jgi:truncated hemoglobin YjbI
MSERIQTQLIRDIPPQDIAESEEKFYLFLTGRLRTPSLYTDKHGPR